MPNRTTIAWDKIQFFIPDEFEEPQMVSPRLVYMLNHVRELSRVPMIITGSYRKLNGPRNSAHQPNGNGIYQGVDIRIPSLRAMFLISAAAYEVGFRRIGKYTHHIHLDIAKTGFAQDIEWWGGKSK